jgi:hypothetical protein
MKIISLLLCAALLCGALISCGETSDGGNAADTSAETAAETEATGTLRENYPDTIPEGLDFGGATVTIHGRGNEHPIRELSAEQTGDIIDDAIYYRNLAVEDRLNVKIESYTPYGWQDYGTGMNQIRSSIRAGEDAYQIIAGYSSPIPALSVEGMLLNLKEVSYIDLQQPWWVRSTVNDLTINNKLYFLCGDIALTMLEYCYSIAVNLDIAHNYSVEDIYDIVLDGKWTLDRMYNISSGVYSDLDGDGTHNENDLYGLYIGSEIGNDLGAFIQSCDIHFTRRSEDDIPYLAADVDKLVSLTEQNYKLLYENDGGYVNAGIYAYEKFPEGHMLFAPSYLYFYPDFYKGMESDYGILPYPKYDEAQTEYKTGLQGGFSIWCIPISVQNLELSGAVMEAMAAQSYRTLTPTYYETALKVKYSRDEKSIKMLDIIRDGAVIDFDYVYNGMIGGPLGLHREIVSGKKSDFASKWASAEAKVAAALEKLIVSFE